MNSWHNMQIDGVARTLATDTTTGLSEEEATQRLNDHGPNEIRETSIRSSWQILWEQLTASMVIILIAAAFISFLLGDYKDAAAILAIVFLNTLMGFHQEYKAEKAIATLRSLAVPTVHVLREGSVRELSARKLVPGDIVLIETGNIVPADGRVVEAANLGVQEAALTGESQPLEKTGASLDQETLPVGDRRNMVYMGTTVTRGRGRIIVTETGMRTELGHIASMIQSVGAQATPLQKRLEHLGRRLAVAALVIVAVIFVLGLLGGGELRQMFLLAVSMAVAAVPEGLPAVVTIALALGSQRMFRRKALIRKLPAVETLGSVTVICSDKTGTLTENRMTVRIIDVAGHRLELKTLIGREACRGESAYCSETDLRDQPVSFRLALAAGALCNDAILKPEGAEGSSRLQAMGDPTEAALVIAAAHFGVLKDDLERMLPRTAEVPFDSERKRMTTVHDLAGPDTAMADIIRSLEQGGHMETGKALSIAFTKGAVDSVLEVCSRVWSDSLPEMLTEEWKQRIAEGNDRMADDGMRVLGIACRLIPGDTPLEAPDDIERDLIFIGMAGMIDPPRPEARDAVVKCTEAGIRPVMITGDHPLTASHIARELGITRDRDVVTGSELERMSVGELADVVAETPVFARVSPAHKLKIVEALQQKRHIVAMTGDGVNDAPALKKADIGVAMGITGTDVSKEVADMVLMDDNFATIVAAAEEGRIIYDNIRKFIKYLLTTNLGEIWVMLLAPLLGMPLPLTPLQILWINLVTDGLPALALGVEPAERDVMKRPPRGTQESIFDRAMVRHIVWVGILMGLLPLAAGFWWWKQGIHSWQTMVFTILTFAQLSHALAIRSSRDSLFTIGLLSNKPMLGAILLTSVLQMIILYTPFFQELFRTVTLSAVEMICCLTLSGIIFCAVELEKWAFRHRIS